MPPGLPEECYDYGDGIIDPDYEASPGELVFVENWDTFNMDIWEHEITMGGGGNWEFQFRVPEYRFFLRKNLRKILKTQFDYPFPRHIITTEPILMFVIMFSILNRRCLLIDKEKIFSKRAIKICGALNHPINVLAMLGGDVIELELQQT